jgi:hypothetical protein
MWLLSTGEVRCRGLGGAAHVVVSRTDRADPRHLHNMRFRNDGRLWEGSKLVTMACSWRARRWGVTDTLSRRLSAPRSRRDHLQHSTRLNLAANYNKAIDTALRNAATLAGGSRSKGALGLGAALKRAGWSFEDMKVALRTCPATKDWSGEADERQFERIWNRSVIANEERPSINAPPGPPEPDALGIWDAGDDALTGT